MKKIFLSIAIFCLLSIIFVPFLTKAALVDCVGPTGCGLDALKTVGVNIYKLIVDQIAAPLATLAIIIGAIIMMTAAGNPSQMGTGKKVLWSAVIGLALVYASKAIINLVLSAMGAAPI